MRKKTLITGAGRGIGEQIALKFGSEKHDLTLLIQKKEQYPVYKMTMICINLNII